MTDDDLVVVLSGLRERGAIGESSLSGAIAHAASFVDAFPPSARRVVDLGSGGGLPGLVIAVRRPDVELTLVDRRERRTDLLRLAVARLGVSARVCVVTGDVMAMGADPAWRGRFDVATARAFGTPELALAAAAPLLSPGGVLIVSDPPVASAPDPRDRWRAAGAEALGFALDAADWPHVTRLQFRGWDIPV